MNKTKIEWCDSTWNPVTGCRHGCPYCYAQRIAKRYGGWTTSGKKTTDNFFKDPPELQGPLLLKRNDGKVVNAPYPFGFTPTFHRYGHFGNAMGIPMTRFQADRPWERLDKIQDLQRSI